MPTPAILIVCRVTRRERRLCQNLLQNAETIVPEPQSCQIRGLHFGLVDLGSRVHIYEVAIRYECFGWGVHGWCGTALVTVRN